jgi:hypothetical protein
MTIPVRMLLMMKQTKAKKKIQKQQKNLIYGNAAVLSHNKIVKKFPLMLQPSE